MAEPQNGRIGGGVLKDNLERQGVDLKFRNTYGDTAVLYLDVIKSPGYVQKIGINTDTPGYTLDVNNTFRTTRLENSTYANIADFTFDTSRIENLSGDINLNAANQIFATSIATDDLKFDFNTITTTTPNTNIELRPDGTGEVNIRSNWNITGNLHATGDVTFGGNLTFGDSNTDNVIFEAELGSNIVPDVTNASTLGSASKQWKDLYSNLLNGQRIEVDDFIVSDASLALRQGNIFYVSTLGSDTNVGDHQHGAFRTLKHALEVSDASQGGPVVIHVYPGEYEEEFPLTVPPNVTITGEDLRNTIIKPTLTTRFNDAFLVQDGVTIENLTVKDFYYNPALNTGHAFRFAHYGLITNRSPYIRNVSVITQGTTITADDPRGFASGNAGRGAYIDGSELDADSTEATMLFHSATFITPGVDCIIMTNGVRVEWLNSFTYFANRGLYATQGTIGNPLDDSSMRFGAELRSIGSANIYGNYGAVADGVDTLMYLIGHNFAYIGTGKDVSNDGTLVIQDNEVVELNFGKIYYSSTDAFGTFRVGNQFYVDFETGTTSIDATSLAFTGVSSIIVHGEFQDTYIDGERIDIGNIRISENKIENIATDLYIAPYNEILTLTNPGFVVSKGTNFDRTDYAGNIRYNTETDLFEGYSTANLGFGGIYSDDRKTNITATNYSNEIILTVNDTEIGRLTPTSLELRGLSDGDILFNSNVIKTTLSNSDLELKRTTPTNVVNIDDLNLLNNSITNASNNPFTIATTNRGFVKFNSATGLVIPFGTTAEQPLTPEVGETRWNTDETYLETWNGTVWQRSAGEGESVTDEVLKELVDIYTLVLG